MKQEPSAPDPCRVWLPVRDLPSALSAWEVLRKLGQSSPKQEKGEDRDEV